jgi:hypothetical protein
MRYPSIFQEIADKLSSDASIYLIGGENMRLKGYKRHTKDCDIVVTDIESFKAIIGALRRIGYYSPEESIAKEDAMLEPSITFEHPSKIRVDVFMMSIVRSFYVSASMIQRAYKEKFVGRHTLHLGILKDEDVFILKCATDEIRDTVPMVKKNSFDWDTVWSELGNQERDTGYHVFDTVLNNIDILIKRSGVRRPSFYNKLWIRNIDEKICRTIRSGALYKDELVDRVSDNKIEKEIVEYRIDHLSKLNLLKERRIDGKLRPTRSNVLRYADQSDSYDRQYKIDYNALVDRISILCNKLYINAYFQKCEDLAKEVSHNPNFIPNRIHNLGAAIIYFIVRGYGISITRAAIADKANVSEPSLTILSRKIYECIWKRKKVS